MTKKVNPNHLNCRVRGHVWKNLDAWKEGGVFKQTLVCRGCDSYATETITAYGELKSRTYTYPDGYMIEGGVTAEDRKVFRVELFKKNYNPRKKR